MRRDLRHLTVCSVDPPGCTDIDDALHVLPLPNGNVQVGVHIADVTHFVKEDSPLDKEAAERGKDLIVLSFQSGSIWLRFSIEPHSITL